MPPMNSPQPSTLEKALAVNLDTRRYGAFAEIGAGQEVVRWFFRAGGAAGTVSKSMSAYDMQVSDAIYGRCQRYVCRERLEAMLEHEQHLNHERLGHKRGADSTFFAFADTVSARNYHGTNECHGWLGIRFQHEPRSEDNKIVVHVRMLDDENAQQAEALGIVGVNLVHGAFFHHHDTQALLEGLFDGVNRTRIEIDLVEFSGPCFAGVDNRITALQLVRLGMTGAALFAADGTVLQPSQVLRKRPLVVERGQFRPLTHVGVDMLRASLAAFEKVNGIAPGETMPLMEITMHSLARDGDVCLADFVSRAEVLETTGHAVMVSDFLEYYRLAEYLFRYTQRPIGLAMGLRNLAEMFDEPYYARLDGGMLESFGRMFRNDLRLFVYPHRNRETGRVDGATDLHFPGAVRKLFEYLHERRCVIPLTDIDERCLDIDSVRVLEMIAADAPGWDRLLPPTVAARIREGGLFGYRRTREPCTAS